MALRDQAARRRDRQLCAAVLLLVCAGAAEANAQSSPAPTAPTAAILEDVPWTSLGPRPATSDPFADGSRDYGPISGRVTAIAVDASDLSGNTVLVGSAGGGVWKSSNAAAGDADSVTWVALGQHEATLAIGALALQPGNSNVILAGTGEGRSHQPGFYGLGLLRSSDGGQTWTLIESADAGTRPFRGLGFAAIAFRNDDSSRVVAATTATVGDALNATFPGGTARGLYYSSDAGLTWKLGTLFNGATAVSSSSATDVVFNPATGTFFAAVRGYGFYSSSDGVTWSRLSAQPGGAALDLSVCAPATQSQCPMQTGALAVRPGSGDLFAWYMDRTQQTSAMFRSLDGGASWTAISLTGIESCGDPAGCGVEGSTALYLWALPNGSATDLYAGAVNIFKCSMSTSDPTCSGAGAWKNLTHALGCTPMGAPARVHPGQLAIAQAPDPNILYFGTAGGMYRTRNATGLQSGSCSVANGFENLNAALGPLAQMQSLAQPSADADILLGALRDGGFVALDPPHSGSDGMRWSAVDVPPAGFAATHPDSPREWFTGSAGGSIRRCPLGSACRAGDFATVITSAHTGGDRTALPVRFLLDPQAPERMLVGTCRVWRGPSDGTGWSNAHLLSPNFETGGPEPCLATDRNQVSALAAGGALDSGGSQVIYTGTAAGRVFVTTNAAGGPGAWSERTSTLNPRALAVASIALDSSDASGHTAYVALLGFVAGKVFKTTNAGQNWADITGDLPNVPVRALLVDPADGNILYAGTDAGVFVSISGGTWTRYGPGSGEAALPGAAVVQLAALEAGARRKLRAATYGRGVWEADLASALAPAYFLEVDEPTVTAYPDSPRTFRGQLTAVHGYSSDVELGCEADGEPLPDTCTGGTFQPSEEGTGFMLSAHDETPRDYRFNILAVGSDAGALTRRQPVTLRVVDYALSPLQPDALAVGRDSTSAQAAFSVSVAGSFDATVALACSGLPAGASCNLLPGQAVSPRAGAPVQGSVSISTSAGTAPGTYSVELEASAEGAPTRRRALTLTVTEAVALLDLTLSLSASTTPAALGHNFTYSATVANISSVTATGTEFRVSAASGISIVSATPTQGTCAGTANLTCSLGVIGPGATAGVAIVVSPGGAGQATLQSLVSAAETDMNLANNQAALTLPVSSFQVAISPPAISVVKGRSAASGVSLQAQGGAYNTAATLECSGLPALSICRFTLPTLTPGGTQANTEVTISTTPATWMLRPPLDLRPRTMHAALLFPSLFFFVAGSLRRRRFLRYALLAALAGLLLAAACGGGPGEIPTPSSPGTPKGTYTITVIATSGTLQQSGALTLTVE